MNIIVRREDKREERLVEELTKKAFFKETYLEKYGLGCDEHYLAHTLRKSKEFVPELNLVALIDDKLVGNIMYSLAHIEGDKGEKFQVLNFGPLSVLPEYQKQGVGSALMNESIKLAKELGYKAILFFGHPEYYPRFGFVEAKEFGITTHSGKNYPAFMAMELIKGSLSEVSGRYIESPLYNVNNQEAKEFDRSFE